MISISNLWKGFSGKEVLRGVTLSISEGETMVVIGRSGCGKSILLKQIIGLMEPDEGQILVDGLAINSLSEKQKREVRLRFGMLFQGGALFDSMTVGENVGFFLAQHSDLGQDLIEQKVREKLSMVGLSGIEDMMPADLSGGMRKRVALARAICMDPKIVLYDEPTTGIDPVMGAGINRLIRKLQDELRLTSIVVTHDIKTAYEVADRIAMLYEGRIIEVATPEEINTSANPVVRQFITGSVDGPITGGKDV